MMRTLCERLAANRVVSITSFSGEARPQVEVAVDGKTRRFPTGPVTLAVQSGAPPLPMFCVERRRACFEAVVERPLTVGPRRASADPRPYEEFAHLLAQHRDRGGSWP